MHGAPNGQSQVSLDAARKAELGGAKNVQAQADEIANLHEAEDSTPSLSAIPA